MLNPGKAPGMRHWGVETQGCRVVRDVEMRAARNLTGTNRQAEQDVCVGICFFCGTVNSNEALTNPKNRRFKRNMV